MREKALIAAKKPNLKHIQSVRGRERRNRSKKIDDGIREKKRLDRSLQLAKQRTNAVKYPKAVIYSQSHIALRVFNVLERTAVVQPSGALNVQCNNSVSCAHRGERQLKCAGRRWNGVGQQNGRAKMCASTARQRGRKRPLCRSRKGFHSVRAFFFNHGRCVRFDGLW